MTNFQKEVAQTLCCLRRQRSKNDPGLGPSRSSFTSPAHSHVEHLTTVPIPKSVHYCTFVKSVGIRTRVAHLRLLRQIQSIVEAILCQRPRRSPDILMVEAVATFSSVRSSELSQSICSSPLLRLSGKSASRMPSTAILQEVRRLYGVSDRLDSLAEQHPQLVSEALLVISGSVRNTATLLEVLVATKILPLPGLETAN